MGAIALTGNDTINISGTILADLADGNCVELKFPNDVAQIKIGKNGNAIYSLNTTGQQSEVTIRVLIGSSDDQYLNGLLNAQQANFPGTILVNAQFIKKVGDGQANISSVTYLMAGGIFSKIPEAANNVEGDTNASVAVYTLKFANQPNVRSIA